VRDVGDFLLIAAGVLKILQHGKSERLLDVKDLIPKIDG